MNPLLKRGLCLLFWCALVLANVLMARVAAHKGQWALFFWSCMSCYFAVINVRYYFTPSSLPPSLPHERTTPQTAPHA